MRKKIFTLCLLALPSLSYAMKHGIDSVHNLSQVDVVADMLRKKVKTNNLARMDVPLSMLPMTINSIDMKDLAKRGLYQPMDALRFATGAGFRKTYGAFLRLNVRGFEDSPVIVDGMRDERTTFNSYPLSDLSDVESLEILKGPASVLQGHSAVGGVLNITRRRATRKTNVNVLLDYNTFEQMRVVASAGGYIGDGWSILSGISHSRGEGWRSKRDQNFKLYTTVSKVWHNNELDFRLSYHNDFYGTEAGLPAVFNTPVYDAKTDAIHLHPGQIQPGIRKEARYNNESDAMYNRNLNFAANWTSQLTPWLKLREQFSFNDDDIDYFSTETLSYPTDDKLKENGEAPFPHYYLYKKEGNSPEIRRYVDLSRVQLTDPLRFRHLAKTIQNQISLEAKLHTGDFKHNLNLGYAVSYMRRTSFTGYNFRGSEGIQDITGPGLFSHISAYDPKSAGPMETRFSKANPGNVFSNGIYIQDVIEFSPMLQAMAALRYDRYRYERADRLDSNDGGTRYNKPQKYHLALSQALTYRLGLVFTPIEEVNLYASLANFYKPFMTIYNPKIIYVNKKGQTFIPTPDKEIFAPMRGHQIELGTRVQLASWLEMTASAYYINQNNVLQKLGDVEEIENGKTIKKTVNGQVGNIYTQGLEVDLKASPIEGLLLAGGYSYTDARVGHIAKNKYSDQNKVEGNRLRFIPAHKFYSFGGYTISEGLFKGLEGHYSLNYNGERFRDLENTILYEGFWQFDLGVSYKIMRGLTIGLDVYNVLNTETYQESLGNQLFPSEPRSFRASLSYTL
ncbi:TonB-dependent receptor [Porphyromonas cangingivalis]|nr:TonB-dependent receptor [Porphyromonas cangingivalis]